MGCFLGCFGGAKDQRRRRQRVNRGSPQRQRNQVQNVHHEKTVISKQPLKETITISEQSTKETITVSEQPLKETIAVTNSVPELQTTPEAVEQTSPSPSPSRSPKKKVTFNSNITTYKHILVHDSIESLPECSKNVENEKEHERSKTSSQSNSISSDDNSITSSVASYPPNHRYHNARDSDDDLDESDDDLDDEYDEEDDYDEYDEEIDAKIPGHDICSEPYITESVESRTGKNPFSQAADDDEEEEVESSPIVLGEGSKGNARDRSDYLNSVLSPVENITQWKAVKSKGKKNLLRPQKENLTAAGNLDPPRLSLSSEPIIKKKTNQSRKNGEVAVDASLSNWLSSPEVTPPKTSNFGGFETNVFEKNASEGSISVRSFEDRPILGALTVEELRQISATNSPRKSPSRSPDEMPIIGSVGTYWNDSSSKKHSDSSSFKGIPNTTSKYREDKRVNWHSTPFETRLDRALLSRGAS
ncbi:chaperone DnaJ-domain superfamily protein [Striga asiatica]|uniref:Chaperone DnaJ-domain superfamily protein n=1 Tax=Striga asiatica TaxID=4170 RepID=A0A5A7NWU7_STRAF|nr:chaperone DnaJ-domain superfamily protein [Striga asiatica]